jgi:hypothetical protein
MRTFSFYLDVFHSVCFENDRTWVAACDALLAAVKIAFGSFLCSMSQWSMWPLCYNSHFTPSRAHRNVDVSLATGSSAA